MKGAALLFINLSIHSINSNKKSFIFIDSIHFFLEWKEWMKWKYIITVSLYVRTFKHKLINWWNENLFEWNQLICFCEKERNVQGSTPFNSLFFFFSSLPNGKKRLKKRKSWRRMLRKRERLRKQSWWPANWIDEVVGYELPLLCRGPTPLQQFLNCFCFAPLAFCFWINKEKTSGGWLLLL